MKKKPYSSSLKVKNVRYDSEVKRLRGPLSSGGGGQGLSGWTDEKNFFRLS